MRKISLTIIVIMLLFVTGCSSNPATKSTAYNEPTKPTNVQKGFTASSNSNTSPIGVALRYEYYKFGIENRLDYVPFFEEGNPPSSSAEYLYYAFALNLVNWGNDKGTMNRDYVENVIRTHFEVKNIWHESLPKGWNYNGKKYTAIPQGIKEKPIYILQKFNTYNQKGQTFYEITMSNMSFGEQLIPDFEVEKRVYESIVSDNLSALRVSQTELFKYYLDKTTGAIVFLSHTLVKNN